MRNATGHLLLLAFLGLMAIAFALFMSVASGCVGNPAVCATHWETTAGVEQSYMTGNPRPTATVTVGGELGSDKCKADD